MNDDIVVVVPTIREASIRAFLDAWRWPCRVIVVEDNPAPSFDIGGVEHYSWADIERDLGADSWIIPRRTDCVRSYGYWKAYQTEAPYIVTLDDDCLPHAGQDAAAFLAVHIANLQTREAPRWHNTLGESAGAYGIFPRGVPYELRTAPQPVGVSHGLWSNVLDFDAMTQLHRTRAGHGSDFPLPAPGLVPPGQYYPMCGMNLAWRREYTPLLYFLLMGHNPQQGTGWPFDRFGDIWAGIISKRILDHLRVGVVSGAPVVRHERASNVWANLRKEAPGIIINETFWRSVDAARLRADTPLGCYLDMADVVATWSDTPYWRLLAQAMRAWGGLYA